MYNLASDNKFRKLHERRTRTTDKYVFNTDVVKLSIYSNSPYYKGVQLWNNLPEDLKEIDDKSTFNCCIKNYF